MSARATRPAPPPPISRGARSQFWTRGIAARVGRIGPIGPIGRIGPIGDGVVDGAQAAEALEAAGGGMGVERVGAGRAARVLRPLFRGPCGGRGASESVCKEKVERLRKKTCGAVPRQNARVGKQLRHRPTP